jgi:hypothetical protein
MGAGQDTSPGSDVKCYSIRLWETLQGAGAKLHTSAPVVIETFTFLERNATRDVALTWKESIYKRGTVWASQIGAWRPLPARAST